jgi:hypothetical protein
MLRSTGAGRAGGVDGDVGDGAAVDDGAVADGEVAEVSVDGVVGDGAAGGAEGPHARHKKLTISSNRTIYSRLTFVQEPEA